MIISCGDQRLVAARWDGVPKVAPELIPWPVGVLVVASMGGVGWCSKKLSRGSMGWCSKSWGGAPKSYPRMGWCSKSWGVPKSCLRMGWCSKSWDGVPKSCPRILDGVVFQKLGWCSKKLSQNPHSAYYFFIMLITSVQSFKLIACELWEELITQTCYPTLKANLKIVLN